MLPVHHKIEGAPQPPAPLTNAVEVDGWVYLSGLTGTDQRNRAAGLPDGVEAQTRRTMENLNVVLAGVGLKMENVVSARVFLTHFKRDYSGMNKAYEAFFEAGNYPARTCVGVSELPGGALVEIDFVARRPNGG